MKLSVHIDERKLAQPFRISNKEWTIVRSVVAELLDGEQLGRGEAQGVFYMDETAESVLDQVISVADDIEDGAAREDIQQLLPAGGARNAVDCAMWDLECKRSGKSIWELTGLQPGPVTTVFTIGLEATPAAMAAKAAAAIDMPVLKIKVDADQPIERLTAIRAARPDAELVVDANQGWNLKLLKDVLDQCADLNLAMIEQPLPRGRDNELEGLESPITLAADESCLHCGELDEALRAYSMVNVKLDKTGGLTEALKLAEAAKAAGCKLMVGNMMGTSLSMAPSYVIAQLCDFVDIDGPLLLSHDRPYGLEYTNGVVESLDRRLWG